MNDLEHRNDDASRQHRKYERDNATGSFGVADGKIARPEI